MGADSFAHWTWLALWLVYILFVVRYFPRVRTAAMPTTD